MSAPVTAPVARERLAALVRRLATVPGSSGKSCCVLSRADLEAVLAAADAYRAAAPDEAPPGGRPVHLVRGDGGHSACQYRPWQDPGRHASTGNPALVTCGRCRRTVLYKSLTGGGEG